MIKCRLDLGITSLHSKTAGISPAPPTRDRVCRRRMDVAYKKASFHIELMVMVKIHCFSPQTTWHACKTEMIPIPVKTTQAAGLMVEELWFLGTLKKSSRNDKPSTKKPSNSTSCYRAVNGPVQLHTRARLCLPSTPWRVEQRCRCLLPTFTIPKWMLQQDAAGSCSAAVNYKMVQSRSVERR